DVAAVGVEVAGQHVDQRRLAGAVRPDEADEIAPGHGEVHPGVGHDATEPLDEPLASDELIAIAHVPVSFWGISLATGTGRVGASPSRDTPRHWGVGAPLGAKPIVSKSAMPKVGSRHWP